MLKILIRLYLVTIVTFALASYLVPGVIVSLFHDRFMKGPELSPKCLKNGAAGED